MATESTVSSPRIDRKFVDAGGNLTQNAYAFLYGLLRRTGGVQSVVIDVGGLQGQLDDLSLAPLASFVDVVDDPLVPASAFTAPEEPQDGRLQALEAEVARLTSLIAGLQLEPA